MQKLQNQGSMARAFCKHANRMYICTHGKGQATLQAHQSADVNAPVEPVEEGRLLPAVARVVLVKLVRAKRAYV